MRTNMSEHGSLVIYQIINSPIVTCNINAITPLVRSVVNLQIQPNCTKYPDILSDIVALGWINMLVYLRYYTFRKTLGYVSRTRYQHIYCSVDYPGMCCVSVC
jgi:hypothetical protein